MKGNEDESDEDFGRFDGDEVPIERKQPDCFNVDD